MSLKDLKKLRNEDVDRFTLEGFKTKAKIVFVHDGDTLDLAFYHNEELVRYNCRLEDFDAPELDEKPWNAKLTRDYLAHICMGNDPDEFDDSGTWAEDVLQEHLDESENLVYAIFGKFDSFGRALVTIKTSPKGESINDMVSEFVDNLL